MDLAVGFSLGCNLDLAVDLAVHVVWTLAQDVADLDIFSNSVFNL